MADMFTREMRSIIMAAVHSRGTKPELTLKKALRGLGFIYQPKMFGNPDLVNNKKKIVVFVDGCFWHKCPVCYTQPKSNKQFWMVKVEKNIKRDGKITKQLRKEDWIVLRFWEHQVLKDVTKCAKLVKKAVAGKNE